MTMPYFLPFQVGAVCLSGSAFLGIDIVRRARTWARQVDRQKYEEANKKLPKFEDDGHH